MGFSFSIPIVMAACLWAGPAAMADAAMPGDDQADRALAILQLAPPEASAVIIVPNLKAASDEFTRLLEGMDRSGVLLGLRPLDHLKSALGFSAALDDVGSAGVIIRPTSEGGSSHTLILPVTQASAFIEANFIASDGMMRRQGDGRAWHVKDLGSHVAVSPDPHGVMVIGQPDVLSFGDDVGHLPEAAIRLMQAGDAIAFLNAERAGNAMGDAATRILATPPVQPPFAGMAASCMIIVDFDPLALTLRGWMAAKPGTALEDALAGGEGRKAGATGGGAALDALPDKPFQWAVGVDFNGLGGAQALQRMASMLGITFDSAQPWIVDHAQFAMHPSVAGLTAGLLNESELVLESPAPSELVGRIREWVMSAPAFPDGVKREAHWEIRTVTGAGDAHAYEIKTLDVPERLARHHAVAQLVYGRLGLRGFVKQVDQGAVITFSQRPAVLQSALEAAAASAKGGGLESQPVLAAMREWLPRHTDVIGFVDLALLLEPVKNALQGFAPGIAAELDMGPAGAPPLAFGAAVGEGRIETALVVPAAVAAALSDVLMRQRRFEDVFAPSPAQPATESASEP